MSIISIVRTVSFSVLGTVEATLGDVQLRLGGARQRALLVALLLSAGRAVSVDRLVDELWGDAPPASARTQVHTLVHRLRKALGEAGPLLESRAPGYLLRTESAAVDLDEFTSLVRRARQAVRERRCQEAADLFRAGLDLWRGTALDGAQADFIPREAARLEELRLAVVAERIDVELELGRHDVMIGDLRALVAEHPLREGLRARLMVALHRSGRQSEALEVYRAGRSLIVDELGLEPGTELRELEQAILRDDPALRGVGTAEPARPVSPPGHPAADARPPGSPHGVGRARRRLSLLVVISLVAAVPSGVQHMPPMPDVVAEAQQLVPGPDWVSAPPEALPATLFGVTVGSKSGAMPGFRVGAVRFWDSRTRWANVNPAPGRFDWTNLDRMVAGAERARVPVLYTMGITPAWAAPDSPRSAYDDDSRTDPPDNLADWDNYVHAVVSRYRGRIHAYELWDFANTRFHYTGDLRTLVELVRRAATIINAVDTDATVACPSLGDLWTPEGRDILARFAALDGYRYCDVVAVKLHPRRATGEPEEMVKLAGMINDVLHRAGVHLQMWATGPGHAVPTAKPLGHRDAGNFAVRFYLAGIYARFDRMYFYSWGVGNLPLVLQVEGSPPTEAALFVQRLETWLAGAGIESCGRGAADGLPAGVWQCRFVVRGPKGRTEPAAVRWTTTGSASMPVEAGAYRVEHLDGRVEDDRVSRRRAGPSGRRGPTDRCGRSATPGRSG